MADVFICYKQASSRVIADALRERLEQYGIRVWYDRKLEPSEKWREKILEELTRAKVVLTLWSPEAVATDFIRAESQMAYNLGRDLSVMIEDCSLEPPFNLRPCMDLRGWPDTGDDDEFWNLVERIAERLGDRTVINIVLEARYKQLSTIDIKGSSHAVKKRVSSYDYTEMMRACEELRDSVREFDPDLFVCCDARSGLWAEMLFDWLQRRIPVLVGYKISRANAVSHVPPPEYLCLQTPNSSIYLPTLLSGVPPGNRVMLVIDHSANFEDEGRFMDFASAELGFPSESIGTLTLIASPAAKEAAAKKGVQNRAFFREQSEEASYINIFYKQGIIPFCIK